MNKFFRFLLISISVFILVAFAGQSDLRMVVADDGSTEYEGFTPFPSDDGSTEYEGFTPFPVAPPPPAPVAPPPPPAPAGGPACGDFSFRYNECYACKKSRAVSQDSCGEYRTQDNSGEDMACASWCPAAPQCPRIDVTRVEEDCYQGSWCKFNIWQGPKDDGSCQYGRGGPYACQAIAGRCGHNPVTPVAPPPPPAPVYPTPPQPQPDRVVNNREQCVNNQLCRYDIYQRADGSTYETSRGCFFEQRCSPQVSQCTPFTRDEDACSGGQLCRFQLVRRSDCAVTRNGPFNCQNHASCRTSVTPPPPPPVAPPPPIVITPPPPVVVTPPPPATVVRLATAECPAGTIKKEVRNNEIICETQVTTTTQPRVVRVAAVEVKEMPKTGLPLLAWIGGAFLPVGFKLKRFGKGIEEQITANYLFEDRLFKKS